MRRFLPATTLLLALATATPAAAAPSYVVSGHGYGHGIGMSQWGAYGYARHGWSFDRILGHYYRGTTLGRAPQGSSIRVLLQSGRPTVAFAGATGAGAKRLIAQRTYSASLSRGRVVLSYRGRVVARLAAPLRITSAGGAVRVGGTSLNGVTDGAYRGTLELGPSSAGGLTAVNDVPLDAYVQGVVPSEVPANWPGEALKAQAVAARSYALTTRAGGSLFDQYPDDRSQVYRGLDGEQPRTNAAVAATAGAVVRYAGRIAVTYFSSSSGGHTESVQNVFYGAPPTPYLRGVKDPYDGSAPRHSWRLAFTPAEVQSRLHGLVKGGFQGIQVVRRGSSRRVVWADVVGTGGRTRVRGVTIEGRLGLYDTWADFPALGGGGKRVAAQPVARAPQATPPPPPAPRPAPPHRADGDGFGWPGTAWAAAG